MLKRLPLGGQDYNKLKSNNYYVVDKTMMIKTFLYSGSEVTLITRPRRFGKSLNMSMMAEFFDITKDSKEIFKDTKIAETEYNSHMNKYPTLFISFANVKEGAIDIIKQRIKDLYDLNNFIFNEIEDCKVSQYHRILNTLTNQEIPLIKSFDSLSFLMEQMERYYHKKVMLFIDEYDTPFIDAYIGGYYQEIKGGLASILSNALKGTTSLQNAMLTGIQRVAKESIFSDLNNVAVYSVASKKYSEYFGFNEQETKEILEYYGLELNDDVRNMYDGYHIGNVDVYNPWSIINYIDNNDLLEYWINTSANTMIKNAMDQVDKSFKSQYEELIENQGLETYVSLNSSFYEETIAENLWGLFVNAGYVTIIKTLDDNQYLLRIPNKEVRKDFLKLTEHHLKLPDNQLRNTINALVNEKYHKFVEEYSQILMMYSYYDFQNENGYHALMLGMCVKLFGEYEVITNREVGYGRCDLILKALKPNLPSFVLEFKYSKDDNDEKLQQLAVNAIKQIKEKHYDIGLTGRIIYVGLAHCGKKVSVEWCVK